MRHRSIPLVAVTAAAALLAIAGADARQAISKGGADLVTVNATVTDRNGRVVTGLTKADFLVHDEGKAQEILTFSGEPRPVSLGMLLDVSGSMTEDRLAIARAAINRLIFDLPGTEDELFLMEFAGRGRLLQTWTRDRDAFSGALSRASGPVQSLFRGGPPQLGAVENFGTAVFDAVADSLDIAAKGAHQKKAVLVLSDGRDTSSRRSLREVRNAIRRSDILVYALGVDSKDEGGSFLDAGVDAGTLRKLTDDTGGRTEVVKGFKNLTQAMGQLAAELNRHYVLGYAAPANRDGRWHAIKVAVRTRGAKVRARSGYVAS